MWDATLLTCCVGITVIWSGATADSLEGVQNMFIWHKNETTGDLNVSSEIEGVSSALSNFFFVIKFDVQEPGGEVLSQQAGGRGTHAREQLYPSRGAFFSLLKTNFSRIVGMLCSYGH